MCGCWCVFTALPRSERWARFCCSLPMFTRAIACRSKTGGMTGMPAHKLSAAVLLPISLLIAATFDTTPWRYRTPVRVLERDRLCVIPFDRTLYGRMRRDLADLRIV